jgi:hypothetical protein
VREQDFGVEARRVDAGGGQAVGGRAQLRGGGHPPSACSSSAWCG